MAILKKILNKSETESFFPKQSKLPSTEVATADMGLSVDVLVAALMENENFIAQIQKSVTERLLTILSEQYDFTPTNKYLEEISQRKKYIGQLDSYLQERKNINHMVENELQMFLQETTINLTKALDLFTQSIQDRIKQAETRHGIDSIKESLLSSAQNEEVMQ